MAFSLTGVPMPVRVAAAVVALTALVVAVLAVVEFASTQAGRPEVGIGTGLTFLAYAVLLGFAARGLLLLRRWGRGVSIFAGLLQIPIGISFWGGQTSWITLIALACSALVIGCLVTPSATRALTTRPRSAAEHVRPPQRPTA